MAKILTPPAIAGLDGLLDLILQPDKYQKYLQDLQSMRNGIVELLGVVKTKDAANELLAIATAKHVDAEEHLTKALDAAKQATQEVQRCRDAAEREAQRVKEELNEMRQRLAAKEAELIARDAALTQLHAQYTANVDLLKHDQAALAERQTVVAEHEAKLKRAKAFLEAQGV